MKSFKKFTTESNQIVKISNDILDNATDVIRHFPRDMDRKTEEPDIPSTLRRVIRNSSNPELSLDSSNGTYTLRIHNRLWFTFKSGK